MKTLISRENFVKKLDELKALENMLRDVFNIQDEPAVKADKFTGASKGSKFYYVDKSDNRYQKEPMIELLTGLPTKEKEKQLAGELSTLIRKSLKNIDTQGREFFDPVLRPNSADGYYDVSIPASSLKFLHDNNIKVDISGTINKYTLEADTPEKQLKESVMAITGNNNCNYHLNSEKPCIGVGMQFIMQPIALGDAWEVFGKSHPKATEILNKGLEDFKKKNGLSAESIKYEYGSRGGHGESEWFYIAIEGKTKEELKSVVDTMVKKGDEFREVFKNTLLELNPDQLNRTVFSSNIKATEVILKLNADMNTLKKLNNDEISFDERMKGISKPLHHNPLQAISRGYNTAKEWLDKVIEVHNTDKKPATKKALKEFLELMKEKNPVLETYITEKIQNKFTSQHNKRNPLKPDGTGQGLEQ